MDFLNKFKLIVLLLFVVNNIACNNDQNSKVISVAQNNINKYYSTHDTSFLVLAENELLKIADNKKGITMRLIIYNIKKDYVKALKLIEKTPSIDFGKKYMKDVYINYYKALLSKCQKEKIEYSEKALSHITAYINKYPDDMEAFAEKVTLVSFLTSKKEAISEIDSAIACKKYDIDFLNALKETFSDKYP